MRPVPVRAESLRPDFELQPFSLVEFFAPAHHQPRALHRFRQGDVHLQQVRGFVARDVPLQRLFGFRLG